MADKQPKPKCLYCNKIIKAGRPDKKFCSEGHRNLYHNKLKAEERKETKKIDGILKNNRNILKDLLGENKSVNVKQEQLLKKGFEFDYLTHYVTSHFQNNKYTFCYNYGYRPLEKNTYMVVKSFKA